MKKRTDKYCNSSQQIIDVTVTTWRHNVRVMYCREPGINSGSPCEMYNSNRTLYRGAGKSLARAGRKQANVSVRRAWILFGALPCRKKNLMTARVSMSLQSRASLTCFRACFLPGRAKDLSPPRYKVNTASNKFCDWTPIHTNHNSRLQFRKKTYYPRLHRNYS